MLIVQPHVSSPALVLGKSQDPVVLVFRFVPVNSTTLAPHATSQGQPVAFSKENAPICGWHHIIGYVAQMFCQLNELSNVKAVTWPEEGPQVILHV